MKKIVLALAVLMFAPLIAYAQTTPTLTFTAQTTSGNGSVVPVLTWSTSPAATSCTASGDSAWTGTKAASGTQTLAAITSNKTYNMQCSWAGDDRATIRWTAPTQNTDGTALTDLAGFKIYFSTNQATLDMATANSPFVVNSPTTTSTVIGPLTAGTWYFGAKAVNAAGADSTMSNVASKTITAASNTTRTVGITVNPVPRNPTNLTAE